MKNSHREIFLPQLRSSPHFSHIQGKALHSAEPDFAVKEEAIFLNIADERNPKYGRQMHAISPEGVRNAG